MCIRDRVGLEDAADPGPDQLVVVAQKHPYASCHRPSVWPAAGPRATLSQGQRSRPGVWVARTKASVRTPAAPGISQAWIRRNGCSQPRAAETIRRGLGAHLNGALTD